MYDNVRRCPNCGADAPCLGALRKCKDCGGTYCGSCPYCGGNESKSF
jgi:rRNA maturation protein Nop10